MGLGLGKYFNLIARLPIVLEKDKVFSKKTDNSSLCQVGVKFVDYGDFGAPIIKLYKILSKWGCKPYGSPPILSI